MSISKYGKTAVVALCMAVLALPAAAVAQDDEEEYTGPNFLLVRTVNTKTSGTEDWVELQKELVAARPDDAEGSRDVWEVVRGRMGTFHIVSYEDDRAGYDGQGDGGEPPLGDATATWVEAISDTIASRAQTESRIHRDMSIPLDEDAEMSMLVLRRLTLKTGQTGAFHDWVREELKPALEAGGADGVYFSHRTHGGSVNICTIAGHIANWAELDGPGSFDHMSEGEIDGLFANWDDMVEDHQVDILQHHAELSY
ncbi:MAG: hypothetical protein ACR2QS_10605 [Woeseiaceae bacterium]